MKNYLTLFLVIISCLCVIISCDDEVEPTPQERFDQELASIDQYLADNGIVAEIQASSGIRYVIHEQGNGLFPNSFNDSININYEGRLLNNEVFDSGQDVEFLLGGLIIGWQEGLPLIQEGGSITLYIPSAYGYGTVGQGSIPPNSILIFDIDLIEIVCKRQIKFQNPEENQLAVDVDLIDAYLTDNGIVPNVHASGIRYTIDLAGSGLIPRVCDDVVINQKITTLDNMEVISDVSEITNSLSNLLAAEQIILSEFKAGSSLTLYVPSGYAYGTLGSGSIGPNANLIVEIDMLGVE